MLGTAGGGGGGVRGGRISGMYFVSVFPSSVLPKFLEDNWVYTKVPYMSTFKLSMKRSPSAQMVTAIYLMHRDPLKVCTYLVS